ILRNNCIVEQSVYAGGTVTKQSGAAVSGETLSNLTVDSETITVKTVTPGSQDYNLYNGNSLELAPGSYGNIHIYDGAVLSLSAGSYNFASFIVEGGNAILNFDPESDFIEINVQNDLRFGDRNQFVLSEGADPVQVQFYTNSSNQIKIGTDSVFNGVVTAPNAQIYAFSRCTVNGALYGKSVWIDTDSTVNLYPNCTEYNTTFDETETENMCDMVNFDQNLWIPISGGEQSQAELSSFLAAEGESTLEVALNDAYGFEMESSMDFSTPFSYDATSGSIKLNVYSNGVPYYTYVGNISVYLKSADQSQYEFAGMLEYETDDPYDAKMTTYEIPLTDQFFSMLKDGSVSVKLAFSANNQNTTYWIDNLKFCDNNGACNLACLTAKLPGTDAEDTSPEYTVTFGDGESDIITDADGINIHVKNNLNDQKEVKILLTGNSAFDLNGETDLGNFTIPANGSVDVNTATNTLPVQQTGIIIVGQVSITENVTDENGVEQTELRIAPENIYYRLGENNKVTYFNADTFINDFDGYYFNQEDDTSNNTVNTVFNSDGTVDYSISAARFAYETIDPDDFTLPDSDNNIDTDSNNDTDTHVIIID
ncbi:MAG: hypothetical protein JXR91_03020, partial [Deltaproteobacteria bacterium]|nr:hypothetical protein [Deltaproteobacteria bacterium]